MKYIYNLIVILFLCIGQAYSQNDATITGTVVDMDGNGISSVTIKAIPGNKSLGSTDAKGNFSVKVPAGTKSLSFNSMGFLSRSVQITANTKTLNIDLEPNSTEIQEVTIAYAARKAETLTGSAVVISGKDIKDVPAANFTDLLQGRVVGLNVQQNNGTPGMRGSMSIRGLNSSTISNSGGDPFLTATSPLFVIDGVPIEDNQSFQYGFQSPGPGISPISMIPSEDIETIVVLKDAQATALYGSRGAYGVILVTTKRGNSNIPQINYSHNSFLSTVPKLKPILGGADENRFRVNQILQNDTSYFKALQLINDNPFLADSLSAFFNNSTDWHSYFYANRYNMEHHVSIQGGTDKFNYKVAPSYFKNNGIIRNTGFTRYNVSTNMRYRPSDGFEVNAYVNTGLAKNSTGSGNAFQQAGIASSVNTTSLLPPPSIYTGSFDAMAASSVVNDNKTGNFTGNVELRYQIFQGLRVSSTFKYQFDLASSNKFIPEILNSGQTGLTMYDDNRRTVYNRNMIQYDAKLFGSEKHSINASVFNEVNTSVFKAQGMLMTGTGSDQIQVGLSSNTRNSRGGYFDNLGEWKSLGYAAQATYIFDNKYIVDGAYRLDGTSTSGAKSPFTHNPTAGLRWNFFKESWLENSFFSDGSMRISWGKNIYPTGSVYDVYGRYYVAGKKYNNEPVVELDMAKIPNIDMTPIINTQWSGGISLSMFQNRLSVNYETYYKEGKNELAEIPLANMNAFDKIMENERAIVNRGHEFSMNFNPQMKNNDWRLSMYANLAINRDYQARLANNERQELFESEGDDGKYMMILQRLGRNAFSNVLFHYKGVYQSDEDVPVNPATGMKYRVSNNVGDQYFFRAGDPIFTDLNGDYILDNRDLVIVGNARPMMTGGFGFNIVYKAFQFSPNFSYTLKRDIINRATADLYRNYYSPTGWHALSPIQGNYYTRQNPNAEYPNPLDFRRANTIDPYRYNSTLFQEEGSYLKFNNATLAYSFNNDLLKRYSLSNMRLRVTLSNIFTWSTYTGPDPELVTDLGYDNSGGYPRARDITFGFEVQF
ncbi:SusC/RagA family TonB-linked outer membrane protein [Sphingobacterium composti Ten et al. 2007 non Yoo et al. 2007]|uniref:SusC/RagA family TonB-linked outer membrane protein n=1 Tax=Sphingobacterium composti TaxID=363260 RepID=UPI00135909EC|nr:SusC/RagA family TonB-linked outer membrane protein [Sphingobacterium composti Ten et al. 2007 non Yoo et al. 2007]